MNLVALGERCGIETDQLRRLIELAKHASSRAYAPYSKFHVGASLLIQPSGEMVDGCNVENASYGMTICAERTAIVKAISMGLREGFHTIAIYS